MSVTDSLLARLEAQLHEALAEGSEINETSAFRLHVWRTPDPFYRNVAVPLLPQADWSRAIDDLLEGGLHNRQEDDGDGHRERAFAVAGEPERDGRGGADDGNDLRRRQGTHDVRSRAAENTPCLHLPDQAELAGEYVVDRDGDAQRDGCC